VALLGLPARAEEPAAAPPPTMPREVEQIPAARIVPQALDDGVEIRLRGVGSLPVDAAGTAVDESALRYFASRGDRAMVAGEIGRLRDLHPGWEPPADLFGPVSAINEQPLWDLYDRGDYEKARTRIAELEAEHPAWEPPEKLVTLIEGHEVRRDLQAAEAAGQWRRVVALADTHPDQVTCAQIDNMWRVARAQHELGQKDHLFGTYAGIVRRCDDVEHRIATLQKAKTRLGKKDLAALFELEGERDKSSAETRRVATLRSAMTQSSTPRAIRRLFSDEVTMARAEEAHAIVIEREHAVAAERLGWIYFDAAQLDPALTWFERAQRWTPSSKAAEGLVRTHARLGHYQEVETLAKRWPRVVGPLLADLRREWIATAFDNDDHATVLAQTAKLQTSWSQNLRGWTYLRLDRPTEASQTFARVLDDDEAAPSKRREAAYGLARTHLALGTLRQAEAVADAYQIAREQRHEIRAEVLARRAGGALARSDHHSALAYLEARRSFAEPSRDLLLQEAWARYHLGQKQVAKRIFERLHRVYATKETSEGLRVVGGAINRIGS
jgi:tetratricopeptide (TPR) repeat protein